MKKRPFIKICGIARIEDAEFAITSGADAVGFIAYPKSPRFISSGKTEEICKKISNCQIKKVGVFVDADLKTVKEYVDAGINTIQLHGNENADFATNCTKLAEVWKAIQPECNDQIIKYLDFPSQKFLIDAFHRELPGGTGLTVNRDLAKFAVAKLPAPVILAGGINPANFADIFNDLQPYGMDINSGVEISPGIKDHDKISRLFEIIRNL